jgi:hypothetical protein
MIKEVIIPQRIPTTVDKLLESVYFKQSAAVNQKNPTARSFLRECPPGLLFRPLKKSSKNFQVPGMFSFIHFLIAQAFKVSDLTRKVLTLGTAADRGIDRKSSPRYWFDQPFCLGVAYII